MIGGFITLDTVVPRLFDPQSLNRYAFVRNNPLIYVDPCGHFFNEAQAIMASLMEEEAKAFGAVLDGIIDNIIKTASELAGKTGKTGETIDATMSHPGTGLALTATAIGLAKGSKGGPTIAVLEGLSAGSKTCSTCHENPMLPSPSVGSKYGGVLGTEIDEYGYNVHSMDENSSEESDNSPPEDSVDYYGGF